MNYEEIIAKLYSLANPDKIEFKKKKFGIVTQNSLGTAHADLNPLGAKIGKNSELGIRLFDSGIYEAKILCSKIFKPKDLDDELAEEWLKSFDNWEICDSFCMGIVAKSPLALNKIKEWTKRESEFEKRAAFGTMAAYCMADKKSSNELFERFFPFIINAATDERLYVKKGVNWALRSIGKRNVDFKVQAIEVSNNR
jgi:3-methyladenine DNA glycosylase AlkD